MAEKYEFVERFRDQVLRCSNCGFCQAVCPVFGLTKRPALNARGKMIILHELMTGNLEMTPELHETLFQCTTCANCATNCPSGVEAPEIIKQARKDFVKNGVEHPTFKALNEALDQFPNIYGQKEPEDFDRELNKKAEYVFFIGCVGQYRQEEATEATLDLLDALEVDYTLIDEVCCSGVLEDVGYSIKDPLAEKNIEAILATGAKTVITACPYCMRTFQNKPAYKRLADEGIKVMHVSQFLATQDIEAKTGLKVTYHDPCDLGRHCGIYEEPRETIKKVAPDFVEMPHNRAQSNCCGAGGGVRGAYPANSIAMARRRVEEAIATGADVLLTECNSCLHNLENAKLRAHKIQIMTTPMLINAIMEGDLD
jgi:Fe-S oxidoreductase